MKSWKRRFKVRFSSYIQLISVSEIPMSYVNAYPKLNALLG